MPPNFFQKPETALKRAQELIQVGKESDALDTLHDTIKVGPCPFTGFEIIGGSIDFVD